MQKLFYEVGSLDKRCYEELFLSEDVLMEQASNALASQIRKSAKKSDKILFVCGPGNNGADGISAARILAKEFEVCLFLPLDLKSKMSKLQLKRAMAIHVEVVDTVIAADVYVDCIFGSGLKKDLDENIIDIIKSLNNKEALKIACDIPSGINAEGQIPSVSFRADITVTMGALKVALYSDIAKDFVGEINVANLGISRENYELEAQSFLLEASDLKLPYRHKKMSNKGSFGHVSVIAGEKEGASTLACTSAFNFGAGLVSLVGEKYTNMPIYIMNSQTIPQTSNVIVVGMGLGNRVSDEKLHEFLVPTSKALVIDADLFYREIIIELLELKDNIVLTPHPKEFSALLKLVGLADIGVNEIQSNRFKWARLFSKKFPNAVLLLKGANTIITQGDTLYVNSLGSSKLAKGGSGDVLAGMIGALMAQNYSPLDSALSASLAHATVANNLKCANFALNPLDLCEGIKWL